MHTNKGFDSKVTLCAGQILNNILQFNKE